MQAEGQPGSRVGRTVARAAWVAAALLVVATAVLLVLNQRVARGGLTLVYVFVFVTIAVYETVGGLLGTRLPRNPIGWIFCQIGLAMAFTAFAEQYGLYGLATSPGSLPFVRTIASIGNAALVPMIAPLLVVVLLFPDGHPPSRRWRPVLWVAVTVIVGGTIGNLLIRANVAGMTNSLQDAKVNFPSTIGVAGTTGVLGTVLGVLGLLGLVTAVSTVIAPFIRRRRGTREERQQLAWLAYVGGVAVVLFVTLLAYGITHPNSDEAVGNILFTILFMDLLLGIPLACGIAILKYRLYALDVVVKRTVVFTALVVFFTIVYAGVVIGIGAAVRHRGNSVLTFAAALLVAFAFQPVRTRARHLADRLVYGKRATPYEILSEFSERVAGTYSSDDVLPRMARILVEGTGATRADVWLRVGDELRPEASWPGEDGSPSAVSLRDGGLSVLEARSVTRAFPVEHQHELLGALTVDPSPAEPLTPAGEKLIKDLAAQAGLVLRNVRLIEELRASRQRIVAAQDEERRRLERNIHDGAQQQLVALSVKLRLASNLMTKDPAQAQAMLESLQAESTDALENLRDLARGIYPPLLSDRGLVAALEAQTRKVTLPVSVEADGVRRYPKEAEAAVYFCCLEALQNVAKYAGATHATVRLRDTGGTLEFVVEDDGRGFDPSATGMGTGVQGMVDRVDSLAGTLTVDSAPGRGTRVTGRVPVHAVEEEAHAVRS